MLKIKGNIPLETLTKYEFKLNRDTKSYEKKIDNCWWKILSIDVEDRQITVFIEETDFWSCIQDDEFLELEKDIQKLIKADLVEKVEDK